MYDNCELRKYCSIEHLGSDYLTRYAGEKDTSCFIVIQNLFFHLQFYIKSSMKHGFTFSFFYSLERERERENHNIETRWGNVTLEISRDCMIWLDSKSTHSGILRYILLFISSLESWIWYSSVRETLYTINIIKRDRGEYY